MPNTQSPIPNTEYPIPYTIWRAVRALGWRIVAPPRQHPEGLVYFCRDTSGHVEPYTAQAILAQLHYYHAYLCVILTLAELSTVYATKLCLPAFSPRLRGELEGGRQ